MLTYTLVIVVSPQLIILLFRQRTQLFYVNALYMGVYRDESTSQREEGCIPPTKKLASHL